MDRFRYLAPSIILAAVTVAVMLGGPQLIRRFAFADTEARIEVSREQLVAQTASLTQINEAFRAVARAVEPSVVHIAVTHAPSERERRRAAMLERWQSLPPDQRPDTPEEWEQFNREFETPDEPADVDDDRYDRFDAPPGRRGNGSGWVYENAEAGRYIVTNNHVIANSLRIVVRFSDGTEREARIVGADPQTDIAVLGVSDGELNLHPASVSTNAVQQGDIAFAFGSTLGFEFSMSQGIISAKGRNLGILNDLAGYENFIQTDAEINPGNSGGPLTNIHGQVVGMNTAIVSEPEDPLSPQPRGFLGVGFAIPANMVVQVVDQLIDYGEVKRGFLGINLSASELSPELAATFGYNDRGVLVDDILPGLPADRAGIRPGDIIFAINDEPVVTNNALRYTVSTYRPGQTIAVDLWRWDPAAGIGRNLNLPVELIELTDAATRVERPAPPAVFGNDDPFSERDLEPLRQLGLMQLATMSPDRAREVPGAPVVPGVLVEAVRPNSAAAAERIRRGFIITAVDGVPVANVTQLAEQINRHDLVRGVRVRLRFALRGGGERNGYVLLKLPGR